MQTPPAFSAIKVDGERAYDLARAGEVVELKAREIEIHSFELIEIIDKNTTRFRVCSGKGMYVRSLARDLGQKLGTCGYVSALRRTKVGSFTLENACSMERLEGLAGENRSFEAVLPLQSALFGLPTLHLTPQEAHMLRLGHRILIKPQHMPLLDAEIIFAEHNSMPVALIEPIAGEFRVVRGFHF
jgi:tRNA pseudouridine55 synthase